MSITSLGDRLWPLDGEKAVPARPLHRPVRFRVRPGDGRLVPHACQNGSCPIRGQVSPPCCVLPDQYVIALFPEKRKVLLTGPVVQICEGRSSPEEVCLRATGPSCSWPMPADRPASSASRAGRAESSARLAGHPAGWAGRRLGQEGHAGRRRCAGNEIINSTKSRSTSKATS